MAGVMLIFAFSMSLVINLIEKRVSPKDELNMTIGDEEGVGFEKP